LGAVATFDVGSDLGSETEAETAAARVGELPGDLRRHHRAAREGDRDAGEKVDVCSKSGGCASEVGGPSGFGDDETREPRSARVAGQLLHPSQRQPAGHEVELHAAAFGALMVTVPCAAPTSRSSLLASMSTKAVRMVSEMTSERAWRPPERIGARKLSLSSVVAAHAPRGISGKRTAPCTW